MCDFLLVGELIGIYRLKIDATIAKVATGNKGKFYYTVIPEFISKCTYLVTFVEDRRKPILYTISKYYSAYKSDYNVSVVLNNYSETKVQFYYDSIGNFIIASEHQTRSASISIKLLIGDTKASIEKITPSESDLIEIPIS